MLKTVVRFQNQRKSNKNEKRKTQKKHKKTMPRIRTRKVKTVGSNGDSNKFSTK